MEKIIRLDTDIRPEQGVAGAVLLQSGPSTRLVFQAIQPGMTPHPQGGFYDISAGTAIIEFDQCWVTQFGYPNQVNAEKLARFRGHNDGHICEVLDSDWIHDLMEKSPSRAMSSQLIRLRHFIFFFQDGTFECIANDFHIQCSHQPFADIIQGLSQCVADVA